MTELTPSQIDYLRLFAGLDNNNNFIEYTNLPENDQEFDDVFWSYYPNIDCYELRNADWKTMYIMISNYLGFESVKINDAYDKYSIVKQVSDLSIKYVFGFNQDKYKELCYNTQQFLKSIN